MSARWTVAGLDHALASADAEERRQATSRLADLSLGESLPLLTRALGDEDWRVRKEATLAALAHAGDGALVGALVGMLGPGDNVGLRNAAVEVLSALGPGATLALSTAVRGLDRHGRKLAVEALGRSGDPAALPALSAALDDDDDNVRQAVMESIAALGPAARDQVVAVLLSHLDDRDELVRLAALDGLSALEVPVPWERLAPLMEAPSLRSAALTAAALSGSSEAAPALVKALSRARGRSFIDALAGLSRLAEGPVAGEIAAALRSQEDHLGARLLGLSRDEGAPVEHRAMALGLAAVAGVPGAIEAAIGALGEGGLAGVAQHALEAAGPPALPALVAAAGEASRDPAVRATLLDLAASVLLAIQPADEPSLAAQLPSVLAALRAAARDADKDVSASAMRGLSHLGGADDLRLAAEQALSSERSIAYAAEGALARLTARHPAAARTLARELATGEALLLPAVIILGATACSAPDEALVAHAAAAGDARTRRAALAALAEIGGPAVLEVLNVALADEEHEVRLAAARALGRLCVRLSQAHRLAPPHTGAAQGRPRARDVLALVERSGAPDLSAATVRALGEGIAASPEAPPEELVLPLIELIREARGAVALAAVDAFGRSPGDAAAQALGAALGHPDAAVARAALLKLAAQGRGQDAAARALAHPSVEVRELAAEVLAGEPEASVTGQRSRAGRAGGPCPGQER